jgi:hypothetical protein
MGVGRLGDQRDDCQPELSDLLGLAGQRVKRTSSPRVASPTRQSSCAAAPAWPDNADETRGGILCNPNRKRRPKLKVPLNSYASYLYIRSPASGIATSNPPVIFHPANVRIACSIRCFPQYPLLLLKLGTSPQLPTAQRSLSGERRQPDTPLRSTEPQTADRQRTSLLASTMIGVVANSKRQTAACSAQPCAFVWSTAA